MLDFKEIYFTVPVSFFDDDHSASLMGGASVSCERVDTLHYYSTAFTVTPPS